MSAAVSTPEPRRPASILDLPDGLHADFPEASYHARTPGVASKHALDLIADTPAHYAAWLAGKAEEDSEALRFGKLFHCAVLEPERFQRDYLVLPKFGDLRTRAGKAARNAWFVEHVQPGELLTELLSDEGTQARETWIATNTISQTEMTTIRGMAQRVHTHPEVLGHLFRGQKELTVRWTDRATGIVCKGRADLFDARDGILFDLKTCRKASAEECSKSITNYRYYVQDPWYRSGLRAVGASLRDVDPFVFVFVEKTPPFEIAIVALDEDTLRLGERYMRRDLDTLARCLEADDWPGYPTKLQHLSAKPWAFYP